MDPRVEHLDAWRKLLVTAAVAVPAFGVLTQLLGANEHPYYAMRVLMSATCVAVVWASYRVPRVRHHLRGFGFAIAAWLHTWFVYTSAGAAMAPPHVITMMLIAAIGVTLVQSRLELAVFTTFVLATVGAGFASVPAPVMDPGLSLAGFATLVIAIGTVQLSRVRLEAALIRSQGELEARVVERTAELATSRDRLAAEVDERRAAEVEALRASRAKSRFLANMSHELRTPLNAIVGYSQLVQEEVEPDRPDLAGDLEHIQDAARHLLRMIDDLLDLSRIEAGKLEITIADVDVSAVARELARMLEPDRARRGISLVVDLHEPLVVRADATRLSQILLNLLSNALKFTERGEVRVTGRRDGDRVSVTVTDTGIGIRLEALSRLFQPFVQLDDGPTRRFSGTGLGLALSRDLAVRMGGGLTAVSELGRGSAFTVTLPAAVEAELPELDLSAGLALAAPQQNG